MMNFTDTILEKIKEARRNPIVYVATPDASDTPESYAKQAAMARRAIDLARGLEPSPPRSRRRTKAKLSN